MRCVPDLNIWILSRSVPGSCRITSPPTRIFVHTSLEFWHKQPIRKNALLFCQNSVNIVIKQGMSLFLMCFVLKNKVRPQGLSLLLSTFESL